ncbi:hypothetical protein [Myroides odoratus]|uniref:hypothetical protein n=1 Tax=Myroides odoratus TaxID=256 RepID=UPI0039B01009
MTIFEFVTYVTYLIPLALVLLLIYSTLKMPFSSYKIALIGYLTTCLLFYIGGELLGELKGNNLILIPIFGVLELGWFIFIYYIRIQQKKIFFLIIPTFLCLIYELITVNFNIPEYFQSYTRFISTLSLFLLTLYYCYFLLRNKWKDYHSSFFLLNATLLIYSAFSCLYYLPVNLLINGSSENKFIFWFLNIILTLLFYLINTKVLCNIPGKMKIQS